MYGSGLCVFQIVGLIMTLAPVRDSLFIYRGDRVLTGVTYPSPSVSAGLSYLNTRIDSRKHALLITLKEQVYIANRDVSIPPITQKTIISELGLTAV